MSEPRASESRQDFLSRLAPLQLLEIFDLLSDTLFWIKNAEGHFIHANECAQRVLISSNVPETDRASTDYDLFPQHIAEQFVQDDQRVMRGEVVEDRLEMTVLHGGELGWMSTSKYPLRDHHGQVIGSYGISRQVGQSAVARRALEVLAPSIDYVRNHYKEALEVGDLAKNANLSISALERRFRKHLGKSPKQFISGVRLETARHRLLRSTEAIATIAYDCGFVDPGYFSRQYQKHFGESPSQTRRRVGALQKAE
ncbi:AraC family transcriptional regulator [Marinimicrobium sp. ABcell2]|uniref:AraC family transcriptional regulator n=1 Tax=Marinimicrobium sp. ABcell2 TaxID=3069751 RepID=UPI0027AE310F|nr:AraC family transcriptional regulator [Marinimicrobium sp. ABcell2]MDQ2075395.1 AraC family transcriptional regulator [Marinimicrobium sp. ABcell2]